MDRNILKVLEKATVLILAASFAQAVTLPPTLVAQVTSEVAADSTLLAGWETDQLKVAVPFNSTSGNVVPQQIKLFGFELGVEGVASGTQLDVDGLRSLNTTLINTSTIDIFNRLPLAMVLGHAKIGLPFGLDGGVRFGGMPSTSINNGSTNASIKTTVWGLDLRKAIVEEGLLRPFGLTVGANFTRATGSLNITEPYSAKGPVVYNNVSYATTLNATGTGSSDFNTNSLGVQAILDKKLLLITPYVGVSANKNFGTVNSSINTAGTATATDPSTGATTGPQPVNVTGSSSATPNLWDVRALAGLEIAPLPFVKLGLYGEYAGSRNIAGSLGLRAQFP